MKNVTVKVDNLSFGYNSEKVLKNINVEAKSGEITGVIGPNAAGKSTLLKCIAGMLEPDKGNVFVNGNNVQKMQNKKISKIVSYLPQDQASNVVLPVLEAVLLGKVHSLCWKVTEKDLEEAWNILEKLGIDYLAERGLNELSGGQNQMVNIAQSLIGMPDVFLLDEPTSSLDLRHQIGVMDLIKNITQDEGISTLISSHNLEQVVRYADKLIVLNSGCVYASGDVESILTTDMMKSVYGVESEIELTKNGVPKVTLLSSTER